MHCSQCKFNLNKIQVKHLVCPCRKAFYCDKSCQKLHWKSHYSVCGYLASMKEKEALVDEGSTARHKNPLSLNKKFHTPVPKNDVYSNIDQSGAVEVAEKAVDIVEKAADIVVEEAIEEEGNAVLNRDSKGKFLGNDDEIEKRKATMAKVYVYNNKNFKAATKKLDAIIDRNKAVGLDWAFRIQSQKCSKSSKSKSHNWTSDNYETLMDHNSPPEEDGTEAEAVEVVGRRKRICVHCKAVITGPKWSYIVCRTKGCYNSMSHYSCLGFPDPSVDLSRDMKQEYFCNGCFKRKENRAIVEADFAVVEDGEDNANQRKENKRGKKSQAKQKSKTKLSEKLKTSSKVKSSCDPTKQAPQLKKKVQGPRSDRNTDSDTSDSSGAEFE